MSSNNKPPKKTKSPVKNKHRRRRILLIILIFLIGVRIALPYIVLKLVNKKLTEIDGYTGHVRDIDLALILGSYKIKDIELKKTGGKIPVPFFSASVIDLSVEWKALFHGGLVGEIEVTDPVLNYVKGPTEATSQTKIDKDWKDVVDDLMPLKINRFEVMNGEIHYRDFSSAPEVDIYSDKIHLLAENLSNNTNDTILLPSTVTGSANLYGGKASMEMKLDALNKIPTFDVNAEVKNTDLTKFNDFLKAYGNFDVNKGDFSVYVEAAAKDNAIKGYAKPIIKDLDVVDWQTENKTVGDKLWESLVGFGAWVFKNHPEDQLATQIDFEGKVDNPEVDIWKLVGETLRNAFIQALYASLDYTINIASVDNQEADKKSGLFDKLFDKKDKGDKKDKENSDK